MSASRTIYYLDIDRPARLCLDAHTTATAYNGRRGRARGLLVSGTSRLQRRVGRAKVVRSDPRVDDIYFSASRGCPVYNWCAYAFHDLSVLSL